MEEFNNSESRGPREEPTEVPEVRDLAGPTATHPSSPPLGVAPASRYCRACGAGIVVQAIVCPHCGSPVGGPVKDKTVAVLLAVFLTFWTWVYTYQQTKIKFWVGFGLSIIGGILTIAVVGFIILFGVWLWAVMDTATKPQSWYTAYSSGS
jgi:hypothetical protein